LLLVVVLPLLSGGIYWWLGAPDFIALEPVPAQQAASDAGGMEDALQKLRARLAVTPADLDGWMLLGRTLMVQQQYTAAADTFAQAQRHVGERADLLAAQAEALSMTQEQVGGRSQQLAMRALELDPDNHLALWLSGYAAYGQGDSTSAVRHWERLLALLPAQNPMTQLVLDGLAQARGKPDATPTASPTTEMAEEVALQISVRLDESLLAEVAAGDVLFVYALDPAGGRMPIASVRRDATFPTQVTLDGTSVLLRDRQLADFPALKIVARVSRSGEATTRSGDLYAEAVIRPREGGSLSLVIDRQVP
jgi:cytochrome c-type biogenesis protein CcmH